MPSLATFITRWAALAVAALAQSGERPKFAVASVKLAADQTVMSVRAQPGGHLVATAPLKLLVMNAYGIQRSEIIGGPDWINADRYDIDAKGEEDANRGRLMLMLQSLLEDRFQMKVRRETRETPVYLLVRDKKGARLTPSKDGGCATADTSVPACGQMRIQPLSSGVRLEGSGVPVSELVRVLAVVLSRPVLDRTDLSGRFDILLRAIDEVPGGAPSDSAGATVFAALQDQLGLKLESGKGSVEFLIIDHIERPTAN